MTEPCIFCTIANTESGLHKGHWIMTAIFEPLNPVTPGHLLVAPKRHIQDALEDPALAARVMQDAAECVGWLRRADKRYGSVNLITSVGAPATQSVFHMHLHIVPRSHGDGLHLPWTGQVTS